MSTFTGRINQNQRIAAKIKGDDNKIVAQTLKVGNVALADLTDINASGKTDGAVLIYNGTTNQFDITTAISNENTNIIGGTY
tara:strand:- start:388 stop:633 length:246 start_codon:yes stop_codon:yes gene_type:complete